MSVCHFAQVPATIIDGVKKPRALQILNHLLKFCSLKKAIVWVRQENLAQKLGLHIDTIGTWIRWLEKEGWLKFTGIWKQGRYKIYEISCGKSTGPRPVVSPEDVRRFDRNINIEERSEYKKQQQENVDVENILFKKLHSFGVGKKNCLEWLEKYPKELIEKQIENLESQKTTIRNKAGWLLKAIKEDFSIVNSESTTSEPSTEQKEQIAKIEKEKQETLLKIEQEKAQKIAQTTKSMTKLELKQIYQDEKEQISKLLKKAGREFSSYYRKALRAAFKQKVLKIS